MKAVLLSPHGSALGNLLWSGQLPADYHQKLADSLALIRKRGYWASAFPECDGITFRKSDYTPKSGLADFRECFGFIDIIEKEPGRSVGDQLAELAGDTIVACRCLVPVAGLRVDDPFTIGGTRFHPAIDGVDWRLENHPWGKRLCDEPGADVDPNWVPGEGATSTTALLRYALIERSVKIPISLLHRSSSTIKGEEALLRYIIEDADHALDLIRFDFCNYRRLEYLPDKAGWIGEFADAYIMPEDTGLKWRHVSAKPSVIRVTNNWLALQVGSEASTGTAALLAKFVDGERTDEVGVQIKAALRALGKAFYLVDLEAAFLHIIYAIDALCGPGRLVGNRQRVWVCACASGGRAVRFQELLQKYDVSYHIRNSIVHRGKSFAELGEDGIEHAQFMREMLGSAIHDLVVTGVTKRRELVGMVLDRLSSPEMEAVVAARGATEPKLPIVNDSVFRRVIQSEGTE
jgi:hypothetical protein